MTGHRYDETPIDEQGQVIEHPVQSLFTRLCDRLDRFK